jgi:hypothetical protein
MPSKPHTVTVEEIAAVPYQVRMVSDIRDGGYKAIGCVICVKDGHVHFEVERKESHFAPHESRVYATIEQAVEEYNRI